MASVAPAPYNPTTRCVYQGCYNTDIVPEELAKSKLRGFCEMHDQNAHKILSAHEHKRK